jgi:hypothetical protein
MLTAAVGPSLPIRNVRYLVAIGWKANVLVTMVKRRGWPITDIAGVAVPLM